MFEIFKGKKVKNNNTKGTKNNNSNKNGSKNIYKDFDLNIRDIGFGKDR